MSYSIAFSSGVANNMLRRFILDTESALTEIKKDQLIAGSEAYIISTGVTYILTNEHEWVIKKDNGGGGGQPYPDDVIYDGGLITRG